MSLPQRRGDRLFDRTQAPPPDDSIFLTVDNLTAVAEHMTEITYITGYTLHFIHELHQLPVSHETMHGIHAGWDYLEAFLALIAAAALVADENSHTPEANKAKAFLLASASTQLIVYTALKGGFYNSPAAIAFVSANLCIATYNMLNAYNKTTFLGNIFGKGWLEDSLDELAFVNKKIADLKDKLSKQEKEKEDLETRDFYFAKDKLPDLEKNIKNANHELAKLTYRKENLIANIKIRTKVYCYANKEKTQSRKKEVDKIFDKFEDKIDGDALIKIKDYSGVNKSFPLSPLTENEMRIDKKIQNKLDKDFKSKSEICLFEVFTLTAMIITAALVPPVFWPLALIAIGVSIMLVKNAKKLVDHAQEKPDDNNSPLPARP